MTRLRLLFVIDSFGSGGAQRQMVQLATALVDRGHDIEFFVYAPRHDHFRSIVDAAGIEVHEHKKSSRYSAAVLTALARLLRHGAFDGVLAYLTTPAVYAELATLINRARGLRTVVVVSERGPLPAITMRHRMMLAMHHFADHVVTNSFNNRDQLLSVWPALRSRSSVILNGVDLELFRPPDHAAPRTDDVLRVLAVGSVLPTKDAMVLVRALARCRDRDGIAPRVSWIGRVPSTGREAEYAHAVRGQLAELGLEGNWTWMGQRSDVPALLRDHDVMVHPSVLEGVPNAVCEALASGLPVIAARIGDNARLVTPGRTGFLFAPGDAEELSTRLLEFQMLPPAARESMRRASRAVACDTLSIERCAHEYEALFHRLVGTRRATAPGGAASPQRQSAHRRA